MATQLLGVLAKAHKENLCHGAVSPNGIDVVQGNSGPIFRFTDLGFRKLHQIIQNSAIISTLPAEPAITAPELFDLFEEADAASDVYMIGQIFYMMLAGGHPWGGYDQNAAMQAQQDSKLPRLAQLQSSIPENLSSWIHTLLHLDPLRRPKDAAAALASMPSIETKAVAALNSIRSEVATQDRLSNSFVTKPPVQKSKKSRKASPLLWCSVSALVIGTLSIVVVQLVKSSVEGGFFDLRFGRDVFEVSFLGRSAVIFLLFLVLDRQSLGLILDLSNHNFFRIGSSIKNSSLGWLNSVGDCLGWDLLVGFCLGIKVFLWLSSSDPLGCDGHGVKDYFLK